MIKVGVNLLMLVAILALSPRTQAISFHVPEIATGNVQLINNSDQPIEVYQKKSLANGFEAREMENLIQLAPRTKKALHLNAEDRPGSFFSHQKALQMRFQTLDKAWTKIEPELSQKLSLSGVGAESELIVSNLSPIDQSVEIKNAGQIRSVFLSGHHSEKIRLPINSDEIILIQGKAPVAAVLRSEDHEQIAQSLVDVHTALAKPGVVRFLLENADRSQSFVVDLSDAELIRKARLQIEKPNQWMGRILMAEIGVAGVSLGQESQNFDLRSPFQRNWSWSVQKVFNFAEVASQACDGSPQFIEDILPWILNGNYNSGSRVICFWGYRVTREL